MRGVRERHAARQAAGVERCRGGALLECRLQRVSAAWGARSTHRFGRRPPRSGRDRPSASWRWRWASKEARRAHDAAPRHPRSAPLPIARCGPQEAPPAPRRAHSEGAHQRAHTSGRRGKHHFPAAGGRAADCTPWRWVWHLPFVRTPGCRQAAHPS